MALLICNTANNEAKAQGSFGLALDVQEPTSGVILGCSCFDLTFTLANPEDDPNVVALDLQLLPDKYEFCDNPGFTLQAALGTNPQIGSVEVWRFPNISIPANTSINNPLVLKARIKAIEGFPDLDPSIASLAFNATNTVGPTNAHVLGFDHSFKEFGTDPTSVTYLSDIATGANGALALPPAGQGQDIVLNGELVIDINGTYTFGGTSDIYMGKDAKITVLGGNVLNFIDYTYIRSCEEPWKTIEVQNGATLAVDRFAGNTSCTPCELKVENAVTAITALNGSKVTARGVKFRENGTGILAPPNSGGNSINFNITDNLFANELPGPPNGYAGLNLNDVGLAIVGRNTYTQLFYGIVGKNSNIVTVEDQFSNISSTGIFLEGNGHALWQVGIGNTLATPTFLTMPKAIRTAGMAIWSYNNGMADVNSGISALQMNNKDAFIENNTIRAFQTGISTTLLSPATKSSINDNTIEVHGNGDHGRGIQCKFATSSPTGKYVRINENLINLGTAKFGIDMLDNAGVEVKGNSVFLNTSLRGSGILLSGGSTNSLSCNLVDGFATDVSQYGIEMGQGMLNRINCNTFDDLSVGVWAGGSNPATYLAGNGFHSFFHGLQIGSDGAAGSPNLGGFIGIQPHRGNRWLESPATGGFGAVHYSTNFYDVEFSRLSVDDIGDGADLISTESTEPGTGELFKSEAGVTYRCAGPELGCPPEDPEDLLTGVEEGLATGSFVPGTFGAEGWTAKRQLYRRLKADPALAEQGSVYETFLNNNLNSTVGRFEEVRKEIAAMMAGNAAQLGQLGSLKADLDIKAGEITIIQQALFQQPNDSVKMAEKQAKMAEMNAVIGQLRAVEEAMQAARSAAAAQLLAANAAIGTASTYEANQKTANRVLLEYFSNNQLALTPAQQSDLEPIADQCPYAGGEGVFTARALLDTDETYDDLAACQAAAALLAKAALPAPAASPQFRLYPNPANGFTILELETEQEADCRIEVASLTGTVLLQEHVKAGTGAVPLDLSGLRTGTYFVTLYNGSGRHTSKLAIQ